MPLFGCLPDQGEGLSGPLPEQQTNPVVETATSPRPTEVRFAPLVELGAEDVTPVLVATTPVPTLTPTVTQTPTDVPTPTPFDLTELDPMQMRVEVIETFPHDTTVFTQGLLLHDGRFYETGGLYGQSLVRTVEIETGATIISKTLPAEFFAEGMALVDDRLIQLTWKEEVAFIHDVETLADLGRFNYSGEGWGLCYDGVDLWMSDGSATLERRDPLSFEVLDSLEVTTSGQPVVRLNELECVGSNVYANVWLTDEIVVIDKSSGVVVQSIDASGLLTPEETAQLQGGSVLNGIAYDPVIDRFYITGKRWPKLFLVRFVADESKNE